MSDTQKSTKRAPRFTDEERAAMKERTRELKASTHRGSRADGESEVLAKLAEMTESDRAMGERLHAVIKASAPALSPTTWYGMPAYAKDGKTVCFFQPAQKFKTRHATLGFNDSAQLDEGAMWPVAFALVATEPGWGRSAEQPMNGPGAGARVATAASGRPLPASTSARGATGAGADSQHPEPLARATGRSWTNACTANPIRWPWSRAGSGRPGRSTATC